MTLIFTALWWLLLFSMACSLAVTVVALGIYFYDLLHSEEQEGRAAAGAAPMSLAAVRALGNADGWALEHREDMLQRPLFFGPSEDHMLLFDRELAEVVELDARRIRRANRGGVA